MDRVIASINLGSVMGLHASPEIARSVGSKPARGTSFQTVIIPPETFLLARLSLTISKTLTVTMVNVYIKLVSLVS